MTDNKNNTHKLALKGKRNKMDKSTDDGKTERQTVRRADIASN